MEEKYLKLFKEIVRAVEIISEQAMEYEKNNSNEKGIQTAGIMRTDYSKLYDKMDSRNFELTDLKKSDLSKILIATFIVSNNLEERIKKENQALHSYKINIIPKLDRIINENQTEEEIKRGIQTFFYD